ncbi:MAG: diguanylate cyclase [Gammaproteobacteria bacterium]|nr:diguanylate cyclase [Gammaproteobacteria bacterium]
MNNKSLLTRLAVVVVFCALAIGFVSSQVFYRIAYLDELESTQKDIENLVNTVSSTASIAAYVEDAELAKEVVLGLKKNRIIKEARFEAKDIEFGEIKINSEENVEYPISHPFINGTTLGKVVIQPDINYIKQKAKSIGFYNSMVVNIQSIFVTGMVIVVCYWLITRPMSRVARVLNRITPGTHSRIPKPNLNHESELGDLVNDINRLLEKTEEQFNQERELRSEIENLERRFRMLFENSVAPIVLIEPKGTISLANGAFNQLIIRCGIKQMRNYGQFMSGLFQDGEQLVEEAELSIFKGGFHIGEYPLFSQENKDNVWVQLMINPVRSDDGKIYYLLTFNDITERRQELDELNTQIDYDRLTGIFNRKAAEERVNSLIHKKAKFCFILVDLNDFKPINDQYGHTVGDQVLKFIAEAMKTSIRENDYAVRWGGDEFALIVDANNISQAEHIIKKIKSVIDHGVTIPDTDQTIIPSFSCGAVFYPRDGESLAVLYENADQAMYQAKRHKHDENKTLVTFYRKGSN